MFGSLHIEKSILILFGSLTEGSDLNKIIALYGISIVGIDSLMSVNHVKRARYCIQVEACVMFSLLILTHQESADKDSVLQWLKNQIEKVKCVTIGT